MLQLHVTAEFNDSNKISIRYWIAICLTISIICIIKVINDLNYKLYGELIVIFIALIIVSTAIKTKKNYC